METTSEKFCSVLGRCGGCAWGLRPLEEQRREKADVLHQLGPATFAELPDLGLRDRVDLVWEDDRLGLYELHERRVLDLPTCPVLSPKLNAFLARYRERRPPIRKGSVRLRVSPQGLFGAWLDFANQDVKTLFEERSYLRWLSDFAAVEIGQRRKRLYWEADRPRLADPQLEPWFETYDAEFKPIPLFGAIGGFTQAGFEANRALVREVSAAVARSGVREWTELFCGNGNFALALAARGYRVHATELDRLALEGLERSRQAHPEWDVRVNRLDAYLKTRELPDLTGQGLLVDPPRAGLREVLEAIERGAKPRALVYVSCFAEVFREEAQRLQALGYKLQSLVGVDQFAHSPHTEWIALFTFEGA